MNRILLPTIAFSFLALTACTYNQKPNPSNTVASDAALSEASYSVSRSISDLSEIAQANHPLPDLDPPPNPASYGMSALTSVDWSGPVEPLAKQLAGSASYRFTVLGSPPAIPVMVTVYAKNTMLADVLRDVGFQCGKRATIVIFPESRVVELRYAKN